MFFRKWLRRFGKWVRGGASPGQIFVGCLLGLIVGMIPGWNLITIGGIVLLILFNVNRSLALLGIAIGELLGLALAPVTFELGYFLIHGSGLEGMFRAAASTPVLALLDLHVYCVAGGLPLAIVIGVAYGLVMAKVVLGLRQKLIAASEGSEKFQRMAANKFVRFLVWFAFGRQRKGIKDAAEKKPKLLRTWAVVLLIIIVGLVIVAEVALSGSLIRKNIETRGGEAYGAQIDVADAKASLLGASFSAQGLEVTDPDQPDRNKVAIEKVTGDLGVTGLLAKRLVIDELDVTGLTTDSPRTTPGKVYEKPTPAPEPAPGEGAGEPVSEYVAGGELMEQIQGYLDQLAEYQEEIEQLEEKRRQAATAEGAAARKQDLKERARNEGYFALSAQEIIADRPTWVVRRLTVGRVTFGESPTVWDLEAEEISDRPEAHDRPMTLHVTNDAGLDAVVTFHFEQPGGEHELKITMPNVAVGESVKLSDTLPINVEKATADVTAEGTFSDERLNVPVTIHVKNLEAQGRGEGAMGLDGNTLGQMFEGLKELTIHVLLTGTLRNPRIEVNDEKLLADTQAALMEAGKKQLADRAGQEMEKLAGEQLKGAQGEQAKGVLEGLFGPKKETPAEGKDATPEEKEEKPDLLKGLFGPKKEEPADESEKQETEEKPDEEKKDEKKSPFEGLF